MGEWLRHNGEAIYNTRTTPVYHDGKTWFTANKDGKTLYAIYTIEENETLPNEISWTGNLPKGKMTLLQTGKKVSYTCRDNRVTVQLPKGLKCESLAFRFQINTNQR